MPLPAATRYMPWTARSDSGRYCHRRLSRWTAPPACSAARRALLSKVSYPLTSHAPAEEATREDWLDQLFEAIQDDDPLSLESLDDRWGEMCVTPEIASRCDGCLIDLVQRVNADGNRDAAGRSFEIVGGEPGAAVDCTDYVKPLKKVG